MADKIAAATYVYFRWHNYTEKKQSLCLSDHFDSSTRRFPVEMQFTIPMLSSFYLFSCVTAQNLVREVDIINPGEACNMSFVVALSHL